MAELQTSLFRLVSVAIVANNKERGSNEIECWYQENSPLTGGELKSDLEDITFGGSTYPMPEFEVYEHTVYMANTIKAKWKGSDANRVTAPDVRRGDSVNLYQYSDVDEFFWDLRSDGTKTAKKLETVINAYSANTDESETELNEENSYSTQVSTHDGHLTIKTTKVNGEPFAHIVQIDTKNGNMVYADDAGLYIQADSAANRIEMDNGGGSYWDMNKAITTLKCEDFIVNASKSTTINTKDTTINSSTTIKMVTADTNIESSSTIVMNTTNTTINSSSATDIKTSNFNVKASKIEQKAGTYVVKSSTIKLSGGIMTHNGMNVGNTHTHIGNQGKPTSTPM